MLGNACHNWITIGELTRELPLAAAQLPPLLQATVAYGRRSFVPLVVCEHGPFTGDFLINTSIHRGFFIAMFADQ